MKIKQLLKRFLKESGIFGSQESKEILFFHEDYNEPFIPFNAFRWNTSKQGHNFWYIKAMEWIVYLHNNLNNIDTDEHIGEVDIRYAMYDLLKYYCVEGTPKEKLMSIDAYRILKELHDKLEKDSMKQSTVSAYTYKDDSAIYTTTA